MDEGTHSPFALPSPEALPGTDATLEEIIRFARSVDPTEHFQKLWDDDYRARAQSLWKRCVQCYLDGKPAPAAPDELLMALAYGVALGPHSGVSNVDQLPILRWLVEGVRDALTRSG